MATLEELSNSLPSEADQQHWDQMLAIGDSLPDEGQAAQGSFIPEAGKALAGGVVSGAAGTLRGAAAQAGQAEYERAQAGIVQAVSKELGIDPMTPLSPEQSKKFAARVNEEMDKVPLGDFTKYKTYKAGQAVQEFADETFKPAKDYEKSLTTKFAGALGNTLSMLGVAILNPAAGFETGVAMSTDESVQKAIKEGASKEQIINVTRQAFGPGATEMAPIEVLFAGLPASKYGKMADALIKWGAVALAEGGQEGLQQFWQNLIAKYQYKPDQAISEGVGESFALGTAVGAVFGAAGVPGELRGEQEAQPPPPPTGAPAGAAPAETVIPPEEPAAAAAPAPVPAAATTIAAAPAAPAAAPAVPAAVRPDSPRLTPDDRKSPIPDDIIDDGKAAVEQATGKPSTVTTTTVVDGKREVVNENVSDLVAQNRAKTQAVINQILQGVSQPEIAPATPEISTPAAVAEPAATPTPPAAPAPVEPPIEDVSDQAHPRAEDTQSFEEFVAKSKRHIAERDARAEAIAAKGGSTRMEHQTRDGQRALVGPDMAEPGKFRITRFDKQGPFGHTTFNTLKEAAAEALRDGYVPVAQPTAVEPEKQTALKDKLEAKRSIATPEQAPKIATRPIKEDVAIAATGREVPVTYAVVEAGDLIASQRDEGGANPAYPGELQPRDRSRGASDTQIAQIAQNLDPRLLDNNPNASDGAPIISGDGVVESGNGRVLAIRRAYNQGLATAQAYRDYLAGQGYPVDGMTNPVLVRVRQGDLKAEDRAAFTREANERTTLGMSAPERAMADAAAMPPNVVALYRGGDITDAGNRDFVRAFLKSVNPNDRATMVSPDGTLSQEGVRRVQGALLARAYGDADLVGALVESTDTNIKAIGGALQDVAGQWAQMHAEAEEGTISPEADITDDVMEAVRLVQRARTEGRPLFEYVNQRDVFSGDAISPIAEGVLRLMFRNTASWTQPIGREKLAEALRFYVTEARKTSAGVDLLGETAPPPGRILEEAKKRQHGEAQVQEKLALSGRTAGKDTGAPSQERAVEAQPRPKDEGRAGAAPEARPEAKPKSKLKQKVEAVRKKKAAKPTRTNPPNVEVKGYAGKFGYGYDTTLPTNQNRWMVFDSETGKPITTGIANLSSASVAAQARMDVWKRRTAEKAGQPEAKFARPPRMSRGTEQDEPPPHKMTVVDKLLKKRILRWLTKQEVIDAQTAMARVPVTEKEEGYGTPEWKQKLRWNVKGKKVNWNDAARYLYGVAKGLATKEINESIEKYNANLKRGQTKLDPVPDYKVENGHVAVILQGPPAAGKSTIANPIAYMLKAAITDVDEAKKVIPGYTAPNLKGEMVPGLGAAAVHAESRILGDEVTDQLVLEGANLVVPTVGNSHGTVEWWRNMLEKHGYTVHLALMDVEPTSSAWRMWQRFKQTGRLIDPDFFTKVLWSPSDVFNHAKGKGNFESFTRIRSDDFLHAKVTEAAGRAPFLAVGARFEPGGKIEQRRLVTPDSSWRRPRKIRPSAGSMERQGILVPSSIFKLPPGVRQETTSTPGEDVTFTTTPEFAAKAEAFAQTFRKILDGYGLKNVGIKVWENIAAAQRLGRAFPVNGVYLNELINVALAIGNKQIADPEETLHHEVIHALWDTLSDVEQGTLSRKSNKEWITDHIRNSYPQSQQMEEGVAHAYVEWLKGARMDGMIVRIFKKIKTYLKALYQALTSHNILSAEDIFRQIQSGHIGRRTLTGTGMEITRQAEPNPFLYSKVEPRRENFPKHIQERLNKADQELNDAVQQAIEEYTRWTAGGQRIEGGAMSVATRQGQSQLERAARGEAPGLLASIRREVAPILEYLQEHYGPTVKLYRKQRQVGAGSQRAILSWSVSYDYAMSHMPAHKEGVPQEHTLLSAEVPLDSEHILAVTDRGGEGEFILINHPENQVYVDNTGQLVTGGRTSVGYVPAKFSRPPAPTSETVDLFDGPAEQLVVPGAEKITDKQLAERRASEKMQAKVAQRDASGLPLFGDERNQLALFSIPANDEAKPVKERIDDALNEAYSTLYPNPLNNAEVGFANKEQTAAVMMQLENYGDSLYLKWLSAFPQKSGMGTQGMEFLKELATKHDVPIALTTWAHGNLGAKKLEKIYQKWGFKKGKQGLMWWHPATKPESVAKFSKPPSGPNDARFHLAAPPATSQQAQQTAQSFLNRGQPVDRAIRMPFDLLGGLDKQNRWSWGKRLSDFMGPAGRQGLGIGGVIGGGVGSLVGGPVGGAIGFTAGGTAGAYILGSKPWPTTGAFRWFGHLAENAKRGLVDNYGLDPAYVETFRKSDLGKAAIMREAQGILKVLSNAGVGTNEAKVLQAVLTGENVNDADMIRLSGPIRKAIDDMGAEAVSLGLISAESFERNRGAYLHRVYAKNEVDQSTLAGWVSAKMSNRRKKIIGDELKGRGIFMDVAPDRLMRDVESFQKGTRGGPVLGEKFRVVDEVSTMANLTPGAAPQEKTLRRVYLPANEAVPSKYQGANWVDRGTWEARKTGAQTTLWRDYTKAERDKMGELVDARYTIAKTFMLMANDLSTGRFFQDVATKQEWTKSTPPPDGQWRDASEYSRFWNDPEIGWVKVPDTTIAKTGGKKRWGALAGKWVRSEIWRDLNEVDIANRPGTWRTLLTQWKKNKPGRNPVVHMNNIMSNVMFMDLADVRMQDLHAGVKAFFKGDVNYQEALDNGAFGGDMVSQEIRDQVFKPILDEIAKQTTGAGNPFLAKAGIAGVIADKLWTWAKTADNGMLRAYQAEDQLFRMATYMRRRSQGESAATAAQNARDQFLNYDIRAPWVVMMRNSLFPFISYTYRAVPKLAENIMHRPWKLLKYGAIAFAANALAYMWDDGDDGEDRERAALRDEEQGWTWLGTPRMLRMPWRDANGLPVFLDVRRWIPAGDIFDNTQGTSALPIPAPLHFGGPLQMAFEFMLNRQAFTGEDITNDLTMDAGDKFSSVADWAWKSWAPASFWTIRSWYWTKIANAIYGATDTAGHPYSVTQAFLNSIGIKIKPVDVENGIMWHFFDFQKVQKALKKEMQSLSRQLDRGLISQRAFDSGAADIMQKFENLGQRIEEFDTQTRKPKANAVQP